MLIYIASPYSLGDIAVNVRNSLMVADEVLKKGHIPFCPCLTHFWHFLSPKPWEVWLEIDSAILERCDALLRLDGDSEGADREVGQARYLGIPIYYSLEEVPLAIPDALE